MIGSFLFYNMIINIVMLMISTILIMILKDYVAKIHSKMFGIEPVKVKSIMYLYLGIYKLLVIVFALVPWIAYKIAVA